MFHLHLEAVAVNPHQPTRSSPYKWNIQLLGFKHKTNTLGVAKSTDFEKHSEKKRMHWWAQQHKKAWTSTEDNSGGWSEDPLYGKGKTLSQHPAKRRTLSRRQVCHCQSLQSREDFTRANTEDSPQGANKARLDFAKKHLKKPDHFWKSIL